MSAPLSGQFTDNMPQATGQFAAPNVDIAPRGVTRIVHDGPVYVGRAGIYWDEMPALISGQNRFAGFSTLTGVPEGTPLESNMGKVGGGPATAESDFGETPATTTGMSQGGTAAY
jgi:hypothetical protein